MQVLLQTQATGYLGQHRIIKTGMVAALQLEVVWHSELVKRISAWIGQEDLRGVVFRLFMQADAVDVQLPALQWQQACQQFEQRTFAAAVTAAYQRDLWRNTG